MEGLLMKTIQEYLRNLEEEKIIEEYFCMFPIAYESIPTRVNLTILEIRERRKEKLKKYLHRLQRLKTEVPKDGKVGILYAAKCYSTEFNDVAFHMSCLDEMQEQKEKCASYAYEFIKQEEILGFFVADTKFTQEHIYEVVADFLFEASFFGYAQEGLEKEKAKLEETVLDAEEGRRYKLEELRKELGIREKEHTAGKEDERMRKLRMKAAEETAAYDKYCRGAEIREILKGLEKKENT